MSVNSQLYFGGEIITVDDAKPSAESAAVRDGSIVAVGSMAECESALGANHEKIDLGGAAMLPGFIDTHLHPSIMIFFDMNEDLTEVSSIDSLIEKMRGARNNTVGANWVIGLRFDEQNMKIPRLPTRLDLDSACSDRPLIVIKHDGHTVIANTKAIEAAGISAATPNPDGGVIDREPDGFPAGPFRENACQLIFKAMPLPEIQSLLDGAGKTFNRLLAAGITSAGAVLQTDAEGSGGASGAFDVLFMNMLIDKIPLNLYTLLVASDIEKIKAARGTKLHSDKIGGHRIGGIKIFADGTFGSHTALMFEPFTDQPAKRGFLTLGENEIYRRMEMAHTAGLQIAIHAIGDAANRLCVELYDRLLEQHPKPDHRHRIEHASQLDAITISEMKRLGIVVSTQPMFIYSEKHWLHKRLGFNRTKWTYPFRSLIDAGVKVCGASDAPIESIEVLHAIQVCATRDGFETQENISVLKALKMFTIDAAFAQFEENVKGSISPGKRADFAILSANPLSTPVERIKDIVVLKTIVGGKIVHEK